MYDNHKMVESHAHYNPLSAQRNSDVTLSARRRFPRACREHESRRSCKLHVLIITLWGCEVKLGAL
jgi:hypothetical protein